MFGFYARRLHAYLFIGVMRCDHTLVSGVEVLLFFRSINQNSLIHSSLEDSMIENLATNVGLKRALVRVNTHCFVLSKLKTVHS